MAAESVPVPDPTTITTAIINKEIAHLRELTQAKLDIIDALLVERDRRYTERFEAQQLAVKEAFERAEGAVDAAFAGSEKAILKAEVSIEKRADATYVSLQELSRSLAVLMPRAEVEARLNAISDQQGAVNLRVERIEAVKSGGTATTNSLLAVATIVIAVIVVIVNVLTR